LKNLCNSSCIQFGDTVNLFLTLIVKYAANLMKDNSMQLNIPDSNKPRVVIVGAGFAGFTLANKLKGKEFQIVLLDKNNYFQFQPLYYQVAMSGLEPSSICFP